MKAHHFDHNHVIKNIYDVESNSIRVNLPISEFSIELNDDEDRIAIRSKTVSTKKEMSCGDSVECCTEGLKSATLYVSCEESCTFNIFISPEDSGDEWFLISVETFESKKNIKNMSLPVGKRICIECVMGNNVKTFFNAQGI